MMHQWWNSLSFLHWPYDAEDVQRLLPPDVEVETFDGQAWVGLVPFVLRVRSRRTPFLPWVSTFPETNVRTYVRGPDGRPGIWFLSLDAARLGAVAAARTWWRLPYMWSRMWVGIRRSTVVYESRRRWPRPAASSRVVVEVGEAVDGRVPLVEFLTARYLLWSPCRGGVTATRAEHEPWVLRTGRAVEVDTGLLQAAGLPAPAGEPLVHVAADMEAFLGDRSAPVARMADCAAASVD